MNVRFESFVTDALTVVAAKAGHSEKDQLIPDCRHVPTNIQWTETGGYVPVLTKVMEVKINE